MEYTAKVKSLKEVIKQEIRGSHLQNLILKKNQLDFLLEHEDQRLTFELIRSDNIFLYKEQKIPAEWLTDIEGIAEQKETVFQQGGKRLTTITIELKAKQIPVYVKWKAVETMDLINLETKWRGGINLRPSKRQLKVNDKKVIGFIVEDK